MMVLLLPAPAAEAAKTGNGGVIEMGTLSCSSRTFDCSNPETGRADLLSTANQCIKSFMGIKDSILDGFGTGDKENCAIAKNPTYKDESGFKVWAVCCLKPVNGDKDCKLSCTRFIDNSGN